MDKFLYVLFFLVPGFIYVWYVNRFKPSSKKHTTDANTQYFLLSIGIFGFFNLVITMLLIKSDILGSSQLLEWIEDIDIGQGITGIDNFDFVLYYVIMMIVSVVIEIGLKEVVVDKLVLAVSNHFREKEDKAEELELLSVWDDIIETNGIGRKYKVVSVFNDGNFVIRGFMHRYSPPDDLNKELGIKPHYLIEEEFEKDKERTEAHKIFGEAEQAYYDMQTGTLIMIYDTTEWYEKHGIPIEE